ncbi:replication protein A (plasmid) [Candidatus Azobacteroides pseudotrichonymphae genomovar. CFP2]|uniref:Replication protein A n=2 Tax=Candidatus Azobacteroides TaxID=511434 RepID=B6YS86_AZOPC|nr:replication protein A [Candidatus Azobacteroides pseudotrichonymphae genomovar. CFP2]
MSQEKVHLPSKFIQSYLLSVSKHPFSEDEKHVLYRLVECFQLDKEEQNKDFILRKNTNGYVEIILSLKEGENFIQTKKAIYNLQKRMIQHEDGERLIRFPFIYYMGIDKNTNDIHLLLRREIYEVLLHLPHVNQKKELEAVISFRSIYARHFYELIKGKNKPITYNIEKIRTVLELGNKYMKMNNFLARVVEQAKKELDQNAPYSFVYELDYENKHNPQGGKKKVIGITITPVYQPEQLSNIPSGQKISQQYRDDVERDSIRIVLDSVYKFSGKELEKLTNSVLMNGGHSYLTQLLQSCKGNIEKAIEKLKQLS